MAGHEVEVSGEAVVVRLRPTDPARVLASAATANRLYGRHQASVFAAVARDGEDREAVVARLLGVAELSGVDPASHKKVFVCSSAQGLLDAGFRFYKDDDDDELDEHFSVDLGDAPVIGDAERFLAAFPDSEKWTQ